MMVTPQVLSPSVGAKHDFASCTRVSGTAVNALRRSARQRDGRTTRNKSFNAFIFEMKRANPTLVTTPTRP
jgi:hypothetical protein